jgi:RNA polymerase sigma factor (sigma-70 family)
MGVADRQRASSQESLEELLGRIQPKLNRVISVHGVPAQDAEDLLQQSLLAYVHKRDGIRDPEAYLVGIVRRQCLMYVRSRQRRLYDAVDTAILELLAEPEQPPQERAEVAHDLGNAISRISKRCRSLLKLRYKLGYEPSEVAQQMGYRSSSIRKVTTRCLAALTREMVSPDCGDRA